MSPVLQRVAAAAVLVPVVVAAVLALPTPAFAVVFGVFALLAAREWPLVARLTGGARALFFAGVAAAAALLVGFWGTPATWGWTLLLAGPYWLAAAVWVIQAQHGAEVVGTGRASVRVLAGWLTLVPCWVAFVMLHALHPGLVLGLLILVWVADSAAFFAGRSLGRRRLASRVSPGKSWEGVLGGLLAVAVVVVLAVAGGGLEVNRPAQLVGLSVVVAAISVLGDLCESLFKRQAGVKDSGQLIPGHGGVLDRIDSLTVAAPAFVVGWLVLGLELT
jgi:phosphatidate cytidylyltransferase